MGADVIKLEPPDGDLTRYASPRINGLSAYFVQQNSGKRNISIDLSSPRGARDRHRPGRHERRARRELPRRRDEAPRPRRRRADVALPAADLRLDLRLRRHRAVGRPAGVRVGRRRRVRAHQAAGRRPRRRLRQRPAQPRRHLHRAGADDRGARRPVPARADRARASRSTCRWPRRCCSSTTTSTASCGTAPRTPAAIRNFGPGDYIVFRTGDDDPGDHQRAPGREGHVRPVPAGVRHPRASPTTRASPTSPAASPTRAELKQVLLDGRPTDPRLADVRGPLQRRRPGRRARPQRPRPRRLRLGRRAGRHRRGLRPRRRHDPHPQPAVALQRRRGRPARRAEVPRRGQPRGARGAARLRRRRRSTASRPTGCCRAECHHPAHEPALAGRPDAGDARPAAHRGRRLGVRDQVGRLPHDRLRRGRQGPAAELELDRRVGALPRAAAAGRRAGRAAGDPRRRAGRARRARAAAVRADPAQGDGPPRGGLLRVRRAGHRPPRHDRACRTRSAAGCCASCSTTGPTGRSRPTASATAGRCSTPRSPRSWRA